MSTLNPIITNVGRSEILRVMSGPEPEKLWFKYIRLGSGTLIATPETSALEEAKEDIAVASATKVSDGRIQIAAIADNPQTSYTVREMGLFSNTDVLIAVVSRSGEAIAEKLSSQDLVLTFDIILSATLAGVISVTGPGERLNLNLADELLAITEAHSATQAKLLDVILRLQRLESRGVPR